MGEVTIFNDEITKASLQEFQEKASTLPDVIHTKAEFEIIKRHHIDAKNLRVAIAFRVADLIAIEKATFENEKLSIINKQDKILSIITPIEAKLKQTRETYEASEKLKAEEKAQKIALEQKAEFMRQEVLRVYEIAHIEHAEFEQKILDDLERGKKDAELKAEAEKLKQLKEELDQREAELELQEKERIEERQKEMLAATGLPTDYTGDTELREVYESLNENDNEWGDNSTEETEQEEESSHNPVPVLSQKEMDELLKDDQEPTIFPDKPEEKQNKSGKLYDKYTVTKNEGPTDPNAVYFVLRIDKDPHAAKALGAYASSINFVDRAFANECRLLAFQHGYRE